MCLRMGKDVCVCFKEGVKVLCACLRSGEEVCVFEEGVNICVCI